MFHLGGSLVKIKTTIHKLFFKPKSRANGISFIKLYFSKEPGSLLSGTCKLRLQTRWDRSALYVSL